MTYDWTDLELPDFLNRKLNGIKPELPKHLSRRVDPDEIVWPGREINRALRAKARAAKLRRKERAEERKRKEDYTL